MGSEWLTMLQTNKQKMNTKKPYSPNERRQLRELLTKKELGQDITEKESAFVKQFILNADWSSKDDIEVIEKIEAVCPLEFGEVWESLNDEQADALNKAIENNKIEADNSGYKTTSDVISEITEVLGEWDGKTLEQIANQILSTPVKYIGDSLFKQE